jgi:hypothetical protein
MTPPLKTSIIGSIDFFPKEMSYNNHVERDKKLENFIRTSKKELDDNIKREQTKLRQFFHDRFNQEIDQAEECHRRGDYYDAYVHYTTAEWLNNYLKTRNEIR